MENKFDWVVKFLDGMVVIGVVVVAGVVVVDVVVVEVVVVLMVVVLVVVVILLMLLFSFPQIVEFSLFSNSSELINRSRFVSSNIN